MNHHQILEAAEHALFDSNRELHEYCRETANAKEIGPQSSTLPAWAA